MSPLTAIEPVVASPPRAVDWFVALAQPPHSGAQLGCAVPAPHFTLGQARRNAASVDRCRLRPAYVRSCWARVPPRRSLQPLELHWCCGPALAVTPRTSGMESRADV